MLLLIGSTETQGIGITQHTFALSVTELFVGKRKWQMSLGKSKAHSAQADLILGTLSKVFKDSGRFFKRQVGRFQSGERYIQVGVPGQADIYGFVNLYNKKIGLNYAIHVEIEVKIAGDTLSPEQRAWKKICKEMNVKYILSSHPDPMKVVSDILDEDFVIQPNL